MEEVKKELETAASTSDELSTTTPQEKTNESAVKKEEPEVLQPEQAATENNSELTQNVPTAVETKLENSTEQQKNPTTTVIEKNNTVSTEAQQNNDTMSYEFVEKKHKNRKSIIIILVILLIALIVLGTKLYLADSKVLLKGAINKGYASFSQFLDEMEENALDYNTDESIVMNGSLKLNSNLEELSTYTDYTYDFNFGMDIKQEQMELGLSMNKDNQTIVNGIAYIIKNMAYLKSDKIYPQMLYMDMGSNMFEEIKSENLNQTVNYDDIDKLVNKFTIYLGNAFDRETFTKEKATIKINGNDVEVTKHNYELNEDTTYNIMSSILTEIKEDEEFIELLSKVTAVELSELKETLNETTIEKDEFEGMEKLTFCIYTKGFLPEVVGLELYDSETSMLVVSEGERSELEIKTSSFNVTAVTENDITTGSVKSNGTEVMTFKLTVTEEGKTTTEVIEFNIANTLNGKLDMKVNRISDKKIEATISANVDMPAETTTTTIGGTLSYNMEIGGKLSEVNTEGASDLNTLTEADMTQITTNFNNAIAGTPLELLLSTENTTQDDAEYRFNDLVNMFNQQQITN